MLKSPIENLHKELGAFTTTDENWDGWTIPVHYGDIEAEYHAARTSSVRTDRSHRTCLRLVGDDSKKFLQNILTNNMSTLKPGDGTYAALLTATGKIIADFRVTLLSDSILLDTEAICREAAFLELDKFNLGYDCEIEDISDSLGIVTLVGPESSDTAKKVLGIAPSSDSPYASVEIEQEKEKIIAAKTDRLGSPAIDIIVPVENLDSFWEKFSFVPPAGYTALKILRLEAMIPRFGDDMDENVNPMEAGLTNAIDFNKGCYVGQEVVAKIESLGHVSRHLVSLKIDTDLIPQPRAMLFAGGKKVGHVTSAVWSPQLETCVALGYVHRKVSSEDTILEAVLGETRLPAIITKTLVTESSEP